MDWDQRRQLTKDILALAAPDLAGVLLRIYQSSEATVLENKRNDDVYMDSIVDLDTLPTNLLAELRQYVDECYRPNFIPQEQCNISEGLWSNGPVVACSNDFCKTRVHEDCFGVIFRQDEKGPWKCPSCASGRLLGCVICLKTGGALKRTSDGRWAHVLCALAIPETTLRDVPTFEPVDGIAEINSNRTRFLCGICKQKGGACICCEGESCSTGFHPTCAADAGYMIGTSLNPTAVFCDKHLPLERVVGAKRWISEEDCTAKLFVPQPVENPDENYDFIADATFFEDETDIPAVTKFNQKLPKAQVGPGLLPRTFRNISTPSHYVLPRISPSSVSTASVSTAAAPTAMTRIEPTSSYSGVPEFPSGKDLVGAIVEVYWKGPEEWFRAKVLEWSSRNRNHQLKYFIDGHTEWFRMRVHNTHVLQLSFDRHSNIRLPMYRTFYKGVRQWRFKPKEYVELNPPSKR